MLSERSQTKSYVLDGSIYILHNSRKCKLVYKRKQISGYLGDGERADERGITERYKETLGGMMDMFIILIIDTISQMYTYNKS